MHYLSIHGDVHQIPATARMSTFTTYLLSKVNFDEYLQGSRDSTYLEGPKSSLRTVWTHTTQRITPVQVTLATQISHCDPEYDLSDVAFRSHLGTRGMQSDL